MSDVSFLAEPQPDEPQPVLDVPVVDMTAPAKPAGISAEQAPPSSSASKRRRPRAATRPGRAGNAPSPRRSRRRGELAPALNAVTEAVETLARAAKAQEREIVELRAKLDGIKSVLG